MKTDLPVESDGRSVRYAGVGVAGTSVGVAGISVGVDVAKGAEGTFVGTGVGVCRFPAQANKDMAITHTAGRMKIFFISSCSSLDQARKTEVSLCNNDRKTRPVDTIIICHYFFSMGIFGR